jgi:type I restriction enzyme R subunit
MHREAGQPHGDDRGGPHRPGHPDHRHLQCRRHPQHGPEPATRQELQSLLAADTRKIIITTIHKFGEAGRSPERAIEHHRDGGRGPPHPGRRPGPQDARRLPNAFLFGLTGTPINKRDRNTFWAFGADEDEQGYMSRYSFEDSIRDKATLPLHFEAVDVKLHINKDAIDEAYSQMTDELSELDRDDLAKRPPRWRC